MNNLLKGIGIGNGAALGKAFILQDLDFSYSDKSTVSVEEETKAFLHTVTEATKQLKELSEVASTKISADKAEIFMAHVAMANDDAILDEIKDLISQGYSQQYSIDKIFSQCIEAFENMDDKYFKERSSDLYDIKKRFLTISLKLKSPDLLLINEETIIVAKDLTPSETVLLDPKFVKGFVTDIGGSTSHSAIMAKTLGILAIVSTKEATKSITHGQLIGIDSVNGLVEYGLDDQKVDYWKNKVLKASALQQELLAFIDKDPITLDGVHISVLGNIGQPKDLPPVFKHGGKGVGLFRSEFLYMDSANWPTEQEQFTAYKTVLDSCKDNEPVTIRTLDIGGDKHLDYFTFPKELNPFLGYRALRLTLQEQDIFVSQLRALLTASIHGNLKIMFPMVTTVDEFVDAKNLTLKVIDDLKKEGLPLDEKTPIGMMIEIPSSALMADQFAEVADFFSIGSNDLIQYTHAVDRMSEVVNYLYQPNSPSILKLIKMSAVAANNKKIPISVCGEMASLVKSVPLLIGLGIQTLSMSAKSIPMIKRIICNVNFADCVALADKALQAKNETEVNQLVDEYLDSCNLLI